MRETRAIDTCCNYYYINGKSKSGVVKECAYCKEKFQNQIGSIEYAISYKIKNNKNLHLNFCSHTCKMRYIKEHYAEIEEGRRKRIS